MTMTMITRARVIPLRIPVTHRLIIRIRPGSRNTLLRPRARTRRPLRLRTLQTLKPIPHARPKRLPRPPRRPLLCGQLLPRLQHNPRRVCPLPVPGAVHLPHHLPLLHQIPLKVQALRHLHRARPTRPARLAHLAQPALLALLLVQTRTAVAAVILKLETSRILSRFSMACPCWFMRQPKGRSFVP